METSEITTERGMMGNPFWVAVFVMWIVMGIVAVTLALALGIWQIWLAF